MRGRGHQRAKIDRTLGVREEDVRGKKRGGAEEEEHNASISPVLVYCFTSFLSLAILRGCAFKFPSASLFDGIYSNPLTTYPNGIPFPSHKERSLTVEPHPWRFDEEWVTCQRCSSFRRGPDRILLALSASKAYVSSAA